MRSNDGRRIGWTEAEQVPRRAQGGRAAVCGEGFEHRKQWIEDRLELLAANFAVSVCGFAVMDDHFHVLARLDPRAASEWSDEKVVRRWMAVYPPRTLDLNDEQVV